MDTARHITDPKIFVPYAFIDTTCKRCLSLTCEFPTLHCTKLAALVWTQEVDCCFETEVKTVTDFAIVTVNDQTQGCKETPYCKLQFSQCNETKVGGILWSLRVRKGKKRPHPSFSCSAHCSHNPCNPGITRELPHTVLRTHTLKWKSSRARAAALWVHPSEIRDPEAWAWPLRVGICTQIISCSCWGHTNAVLVLPGPSWLCKAFSSLLLVPAFMQLYKEPDEGPPRDSARDPCVKQHPLFKGRCRKEKKNVPSCFFSPLYAEHLFKHLSQNPAIWTMPLLLLCAGWNSLISTPATTSGNTRSSSCTTV